MTPSVTNTTGYITGGTVSGTAVTVSASELVSGTKSISANGTNIDVTNYAAVDVAVGGSGYVTQAADGSVTFSATDGPPTLISKSITQNGTYNPTSDNADGYSSVTVDVSGSGGSSYTFIASTEYTVSTSSTTEITVADFDTGDTSIWTSDKMVYVKIRDKAGRRNGYYYGSDSFIINLIKGNGLTATSSYQITGSSFHQPTTGYLQQTSLCRNSSSTAITGYGIYPTFIYNDGRISLRAKYATSSYPTGTIDGTFTVEVYLLDFVNNISPLNG